MATKKALAEKKKQPSARGRLVFDEPHIFHTKSEQSLAHLQQSREFLPCTACSQEADRRQEPSVRPHSSYTRPPPLPVSRTVVASEQRPSTAITKKRLPPTQADLERLSRPKTILPEQYANNCNWSNFINKRSKYAIKTPYAQCQLNHVQENSENRPPFINYGGRYGDKQHGEKRTFNSLAIHQMKHHEVEEQRISDVLRERRLRLQAENYFREMEQRKLRAQELRDRAARSSTEYRDNYRPPQDYQPEGTFSRHQS